MIIYAKVPKKHTNWWKINKQHAKSNHHSHNDLLLNRSECSNIRE